MMIEILKSGHYDTTKPDNKERWSILRAGSKDDRFWFYVYPFGPMVRDRGIVTEVK